MHKRVRQFALSSFRLFKSHRTNYQDGGQRRDFIYVNDCVEFIDMPEPLRETCHYFTEAKMDRLRAAGYSKEFTSLEEGVALYIQRYLFTDNAYL